MASAMNWRQRLGAFIGGFYAGQHHRRLRGFRGKHPVRDAVTRP